MGSIKISLERLAQIAEILQKPLEAFFIDFENNERKTQDDIQQIKMLQELVIKQEKIIADLEEKLMLKAT